jgi:2-hydroxy-3-keto-5-methylthiopentenyl-1-phosphate phosphatase
MSNYDELYGSFQSLYQDVKKELKTYGIDVVFTSVGEQDSVLKIHAENSSPEELPPDLKNKMLECMDLFEQLRICRGTSVSKYKPYQDLFCKFCGDNFHHIRSIMEEECPETKEWTEDQWIKFNTELLSSFNEEWEE